MEWTGIIKELGGGLPAVLMVGAGFVIWRLMNRLETIMDRWLAREREHSSEMLSAIQALDSARRRLEGGN